MSEFLLNRPAAEGPSRILLVEDDPGLSDLFQLELASTGLPVHGVKTGAAALASLAEQPDCLVLLDYSLPDMTAQELIAVLQTTGRTPPFIIITGHGDEKVAVNMMKLGARDYLVKDASLLDRFGAIVSRVLRELRGERRSESSVRLFQAVFEGSDDALMILNAEGFLDCNARALALFGFDSKEQFLGCHPGELSPPCQPDGADSIQASKARIEKALHEGSVRFEWVHRRRSGADFPAEVLLSAFELDHRPLVQATVRDVTQRKLAEEALLESSERFRAIVSGTSAGYFRLDSKGCFEFVNEAWLRLHGFDHADQVLGQPYTLTQTPADLPQARRIVEELLQGVEIPPGEFSRRCRDGTTAFHSYSVRTVRQGGRIIGAEGFLIDVTELRRAQADYALLFDRMIDGFALHQMLFDAQGKPTDYRFLAINPAFERLTGMLASRVIGRSLREVLPYEDPFWIETYGRVVLTGEPASFEHASAELGRVFQVNAFRTAPEQFACVFVDITQQHEAQAALRASEAELFALYEHAPVMMILLDSEGRVRRVNRATSDYTRLGESDVLGFRVGELLHCVHHLGSLHGCGASPNCPDCPIRQLVEQTHSTGVTSHRVEVRPVRLVGQSPRELVMLASAARIPGDGQPLVLLCLEDVTEKKSLEAKFLRAQRHESIGALASGIAHDLNNVLSPVLMSMTLLRPLAKDPDDHALLDMLEGGVKRGASIIRQLLLFGRGSERGRTRVQPEDVIQEMVHIIRETFPKSIQLQTRIDGGLPAIVGDPTQLHQVLLNLCVNARDAMSPAEGTLTLAAREVVVEARLAQLFPEAKTGPHVVFEVTDTGPGVPPEIQHRIFEPFFTTKEIGQGTGLGLATVQSIVRGHGGFVDLETRPGLGATFRVFIPITETAALPAFSASSGPTLAQGRGELVLLVDDEPSIQHVVCQGLKANQYRVLGARDGLQALRLLEEHGTQIRVAIVDMMMPNLAGAATLRLVRERHPNIVLIAISGLLHLEAEAKDAGGDSLTFLPKPFSLETLLSLIDKGLHR